MSEKDFDKGYKSGFKFGKEVANEEWLNKVKQVREDIKITDFGIYKEPWEVRDEILKNNVKFIVQAYIWMVRECIVSDIRQKARKSK